MADATKDEKRLEEINERFRYAAEEWRDIKAEGAIDMRYVSGDPWDPADRRAREDGGRPCLSLDELGQYVNQLINEIRQHKRAIQVTPVGDGANDDSAELRAGLIRQIEYRSNAQQAYTTMFENTVQRSYGYLRVLPRFVYSTPILKDGRPTASNFEQELIIEPLVNPDLVLIDPGIRKPDGSDMTFAFVFEELSTEEFKRRWPKAKIRDFSPDEFKIQAPSFIKDKAIVVAEYWTKDETDARELLQIQTSEGPIEVFADELEKRPSEEFILHSRKVPVTKVTQYITNGVEILETHDFPGEDIPIVCCFGKVLYVDRGDGSKRMILSMVRLARDPQMLYCYYRTAEAEQVGMSTKFPYFVRRGSLKPDQLVAIQKSLHEPVAAIEVETSAEGMPMGTMPEMPVRNPFEPAIQALEVGAEGARRAIQAAIGQSPLPTMAQRRNEKSGVALKHIEETGQKGSYHFIDHYENAITRTGAIINALLPHYYDTARDVTTRNEEDEAERVRINDPEQPGEDGAVPVIDESQHDVTLSTGPSYDSERELASEFTDTLVQNIEMVAGVAGQPAAAKVLASAIRLKNLGPIGQSIADTISPPEQEQGQPNPQQMAQVIQQLQAKVQELSQLADKNMADLKKTELQEQADNERTQYTTAVELQKAQAEIASKERLEMRKLEVELEIEMAKLGSAQSMARAELEQQELHHHDEQALRHEALGAQQAQATLDREAAQEQAAMKQQGPENA